jgi:hypothetical protein
MGSEQPVLAFGERGKVIRRHILPLDDAEVDFNLIQPAGVIRREYHDLLVSLIVATAGHAAPLAYTDRNVSDAVLAGWTTSTVDLETLAVGTPPTAGSLVSGPTFISHFGEGGADTGE